MHHMARGGVTSKLLYNHYYTRNIEVVPKSYGIHMPDVVNISVSI